MRTWQRVKYPAAVAGLVAKGAVFYLFFLWAGTGEAGAGALRGAVAADVFTWIVLTMISLPTRRMPITLGLAFELVLVVAYLNRGTWFEIPNHGEGAAMTGLAFFAVLMVKVGYWAAQQAMKTTGVEEPAST